MSKKRIHIDELFRRGLGNMQMPVAGDDWAAMQAQLAAAQQKRKRRRAIWWWLFGLLLVAGGSLSVYSVVNNRDENSAPLVVNETGVDNSLPNSTSNSKEKETSYDQSPSPKKDGVTKNQDSNNANADLNNNLSQTAYSKSKSTKGKQTNTFKPAKGEENLQGEAQSTEDNTESNELPKSTENAPDKGTDNTPPNYENPIPPANTTSQQTVTTTKTDSVPSDNSSEEEKLAKAKKAKETTPPAKLLNKPSVARFGLGFAPAIGNWQAPQNTRYGQILKQGGRSSYGTGVSFTADFRITNKWWLGSGVDVSAISSRGNYNYTHQIYDSIPVIGPGGEIKGYFYTNYRDTSHNYNLHSVYTFVTIPVQTWFNIPLNQKTGIILGSNVQFHYLAMAKGEYINPNTLFSQNASVNNGQFRKLNFSVALQMGYYYTLSNKWRFEGVLQMQQMGKSMFTNSVGADVRLQSIGLNLGIVYNLMR